MPYTAAPTTPSDTPSAVRDACMHRLFEVQAARDPDAVAVVFDDSRLTYGQLNTRANQFARYLRGRGVGRNSLVGIGLRSPPFMPVALLAVWKAGGAYVPLDPSYPRERLAFMMRDANLTLILTDAVTRRLFRNIASDIKEPKVSEVGVETCWLHAADERGDNLNEESEPTDLACVTYSPGAAGQSDRAMLTHAGLTDRGGWTLKETAIPGGPVPVHSSLPFDLTVMRLYPPLLAGAKLELLDEDESPAVAYPSTSTEEVVLTAFEEIFGRRDLESTDDFFLLDGSSSMAMRLMMKLRNATGLDLPQRLLFEHPSVAALADAIDLLSWADASAFPCRELDGREQLRI
jgi:non-ribosomal peptide synthetase component F/acyl carrier protein